SVNEFLALANLNQTSLAAMGGGISSASASLVSSEAAALNSVTAASPPSGTACNGVYTGTFGGNITVSAGQVCDFRGGTVTGNIAMTGGSLILDHTLVGKNILITGGAFFLSTSTVKGNLQISNIPAAATVNLICGISVTGNVAVTNDETAVQIGS